MKLIFLYGPPGVGKLTVARELAHLTGFKLFHSHMILNDLSRIFGYDSDVRRKLEFEFKTRIMEEAIGSNTDIITTGSITRVNIHYYDNLVSMFKNSPGEILFVRLTCETSTLMERVKLESRSEKINSPEKLKEFLEKYPENLEKFGPGEQLTIDTTSILPPQAAQKILEHFSLI